MHLVLEQSFHVEARFGTYGLDLLALVADDHLLLAIALHQDEAMDVVEAILFHLEALDLHRHRVGQLLASEAHQLLADNLGGHEARRTVGHVVFREEVNVLGQQRLGPLADLLHVGALLGTDGQDVGKVHLLAQPLQVGQQIFFLFDVVDLVDRQHHRALEVAQLAEHHLVVLGPVGTVDHEHHHGHVPQGTGGGAVHQAVDGPLLFDVQTRGIHIDGLVVILGVDPQDPVTGGLGFLRGNADLLAKQLVEQGGLAHVGAAHDGDKAAVGSICHDSFSNACCAAACSALRRLVPTPTSGPSRPSTSHWTVNSWLWASPLTLVTV